MQRLPLLPLWEKVSPKATDEGCSSLTPTLPALKRSVQRDSQETRMIPAVSFQQVSRHFGQVRAVDGADLEVVPGEFFAMLGPSGSGKTTCLRLIAGFEQPTTGHIEIFGERADGV